MKNCKCGALVSEVDPNGDTCSRTGRFVHACGGVEIRASIDVERILDDFCDELELEEA